MAVTLKKDLTIIVSTIVLNTNNNKILMIQEAKPECLGLWYLPAGRLERYETLEAGAQRECKEESGLEVEIVAISSVEMFSMKWIRVNFVGKAIGGELKNIPNKESISADWLPLSVVLKGGNDLWPLRCSDIVRVVQCMIERGHSNPGIVPTVVSHTCVQFQIFFRSENYVLIDSKTNKAPVVTLDNIHSIGHLFDTFYRNNFRDLSYSKTVSILILELAYSGTLHKCHDPTDGIHIKLLIQLSSCAVLTLESLLEWCVLVEENGHPKMTSIDLPQLFTVR